MAEAKISSPVPPPSALSGPKKRKARETPSKALQNTLSRSSSKKAKSKVRFGDVEIRTHALALWGGGGVPADDGPPLGLSWDVLGPERRVRLEEFETERELVRRPKDDYCSVGCIEAAKRQLMLVQFGSSLKQIRFVQEAVAKLNEERWQTSKMLFEETWLFSAPSECDECDMLAMAGHYASRPFHIDPLSWVCTADIARSLQPLFPKTQLLDDTAEGIDWKRLAIALRDAKEAIVLIVDCNRLNKKPCSKNANKHANKLSDRPGDKLGDNLSDTLHETLSDTLSPESKHEKKKRKGTHEADGDHAATPTGCATAMAVSPATTTTTTKAAATKTAAKTAAAAAAAAVVAATQTADADAAVVSAEHAVDACVEVGRLVGCVANALVARQVACGEAEHGALCVLLQGWVPLRIRATWSAGDDDEYIIMPLT